MARPAPRGTAVALALVLVGLLVAPSVAPARAEVPTLPVQFGRAFLTGLSVDPTEPGGSSVLTFALNNPLAQPLRDVQLEFGLYAFNPFPGTGRTAVPAGAGTLGATGGTGTNLSISVGTLVAHAANWSTPVTVAFTGGAPEGTYSIRDSLRFVLNGSGYLLDSVGNFPPAVWQNATVLPNGTPTLNLSRLGVSGVLPETAVLVRSTTPLDVALYVLLGLALVLALAGAYVAGRRRRSSSRSGTSSAPEESQAPSALGKRRRRDGD